MFSSPWLIVIAIGLLIFGLLLYFMGVKILENDHIFLMMIGVFFVLYVLAVIVMRHYVALPSGGADVSALSSVFSSPSQ